MRTNVVSRCAALLLVGVLAGAVAAQEKDKEPPAEQLPVPPSEQLTVPPREIVYPTEAAVNELLKKEPITLANWPVWRQRLLDWVDDLGTGTDPAFTAARKFVKEQAGDKADLPEPLAKDALAWYLLGRWYISDASDKFPTKEQAAKAETALRRSIALDGKLALAHRNLARALLHQEPLERAEDPDKLSQRFRDAINAIQESSRLNPKLPLADVKAQAGQIAGKQGNFRVADILLLQALGEAPALAPEILTETGVAVLLNPQRDYDSTETVLAELAKNHPKDGSIQSFLGLAQLVNYHTAEGAASLARSKALGADPEKVVPDGAVSTGARAVTANRNQNFNTANDVFVVLQEYFPKNKELPVHRALALAARDDLQGAVQQLDHAQSIGTDVPDVAKDIARLLKMPPSGDWVNLIRTGAVRERYQGIFTKSLIGVAGFYAVLVVLMLLVGSQVGKTAPAAASAVPLPGPSGGYGLALQGGLGLFHVLALLLFAGLVVVGAGLLFLLLNSPQMDFKYLCALIVVGILAWVYLSMLFSPRARERVGVVAGKLDSPRFRQVLDEAAQKADAEPIGEVRIAPGTAVSLRFNSWGPLGLFGSQPVLLLGMTTLRLLTVGELRALLAQQCVQFNRRETGAGRSAYRGLLRINDAMADIWHGGGSANYLNPFYLIFAVYHKAVAALAGGFARARALAADRAAAQLESAPALEGALEKAVIDAPILNGKLQQLARELVVDAPDLSNIYAAWDDLCGPQRAKDEKEYAHLVVSAEQLAQERRSVRTRPGCLRAERLTQLAALPKGAAPNDSPALELFDNLEPIEEQLTEIITAPLLAGRPKRQGAGAAAR